MTSLPNAGRERGSEPMLEEGRWQSLLMIHVSVPAVALSLSFKVARLCALLKLSPFEDEWHACPGTEIA